MNLNSARKEPIKVVLDSNALFVPFQFRINIFSELEHLLSRRFELVLLSAVKRELEILVAKSKFKIRKDICHALEFAENFKLIEVATSKKELVDDIIVRVARRWNAVVFTNDKLLRRRLRDISVPVIYVRQNSRLEIDGIV